MDYAALRSHMFLWLSSVSQHLVTLVTGGVVMAVVWFLENKFGNKYPHLFAWHWKRYLIFGFICFSIFQSWESEYLSRTGRDSDLRAANISRDYALEAKRLAENSDTSCQSALHSSAENEARALAQSMVALGQTQMSQSKVQECLLALGKAQQVEPARITVTLSYMPWINKANQSRLQVATILAQSNRRITSAQLLLTCKNPFTLIDAQVPQIEQYAQMSSNPVRQVTSNSASISINSPPLEINRPVLFWVQAESFQGCEVEAQNL